MPCADCVHFDRQSFCFKHENWTRKYATCNEYEEWHLTCKHNVLFAKDVRGSYLIREDGSNRVCVMCETDPDRVVETHPD